MERLETEVLVVGGGPVGLSAATLLGRLGVDTVMVERRPGAADHPRARSINIRTSEIFRAWGLDDELDAVSLPVEWTRHMRFAATVAGPEVACLDTDTQGELHPGGRPSPCPWRLSSQDQFEPVIRRYTDTLPGAQLRWEHELVRWLEDRAGQPSPQGQARAQNPAQAQAQILDVADIAWTPDHFDRQRWFLLAAIERAGATSEHSRPLRLWARMIEAHPRDSVQFGRRWMWQPSL